MFYFDISVEKAKSLGLLVNIESGQGVLNLLQSDFSPSFIHWDIIVSNLGYALIVIIVIYLNMILNASTYESTHHTDYPLNKEFKNCGGANIINSLFGAIPSYSTILSITLCDILGAKTRFPIIACLFSFITALVLGDRFFSLLPIPVIAGLTFYLGAHFFVNLLIDKREQLSNKEYTLVVISSMIIAFWSLPIGLIFATIGIAFLFTFEYSRTDIVMHSMDGTIYTSNVERPSSEANALENYGAAMLILRLKGYVFFGTANRILETINERIA